ncbi:glycosyltransferase family 4 protein [Flagellimonas nanhaiensis]|uniref:Glycosyl transferase family 1 n=1 Tax=Flagellimonas nanhaiensis TaxID=2292706 RepID=A0A371JV75_9FLAO|nr:glycosyltransferase family 4 protein [Allomuricauda nanhaiensis]RDY61703.1 glycosyl transferase family 1 [Allomuricauda nanhaiensis]
MQKVLVIAYYWPPAGGPGVQRWLKFTKYLPEMGFEPIVYVPENPSYPIVDEKLLEEVPEGIKIIKQRIQEPYAWASLFSKSKTKTISSGIISEKNPSFLEKLLLWIRGNLFIPDARKFWVKPSVRTLSKIIQDEEIKIVITTGPPHSLHLIGLELKKSHQLDWIADFRDPWTSIGYHKKLRLSKSAQKKHKRLEKLVLSSADKILVTSNTTKKEFEAITTTPIQVITNGYDNEWEPTELDKDFTISHIGSLLTGRNPKALWKALSELVLENEEFKKVLKIQLAGVVGEEVLKSLEGLGLTPYLKHLGYLSHNKVLELQRKSQILLLLEIDTEETRGIIPGKLFEYFSAKRPILAIGPTDWEAGNMIKTANAGIVGSHSDTDTVKSVLLDWFDKYRVQELNCMSKDIEKYHRRELTRALANYIQWELS